MTTFLLIALIVAAIAALVVTTAHVVRHDGRGPQRPPSSHFRDPQLMPPSEAGRELASGLL